MKFTVQYIPLSSIKSGISIKLTEHLKKLRNIMWDCMNVLVVQKSKKDGHYVVVSGQDRLDYLKKNTKNKYAPCIVDEPSGFKTWLTRFSGRQPIDDFPMHPKSWKIVRAFLTKEPRFQNLSRAQQMKVLLLAVQYKKTVIASMQNRVSQIVKMQNGE
ncbi:hypothetical protein [Fictibacillus terranigra]|uniref:ParB/Sulfiredoxin domain-containing protein n=1 Tax=Fictibacillus terranigra TaxID=3058424 RepID=A0ABT8E1C0_9BACL|nr:hypothetical protein [Fictibacillus sp. CENA-BCM004]MDN4071708.1 hypothetical protein [Fictibacillus sp. CENA-BCM004]